MPQRPDWSAGYGVYGFQNPYDAQVARAASKATSISPATLVGGMLNPDIVADPRVSENLRRAATRQYVDGAAGGMDMGGIIPADKIRMAVNATKINRGIQLDHLGGNLRAQNEIQDWIDPLVVRYKRLVNDLYKTHPRVASTIGTLGVDIPPSASGVFYSGPASPKTLLRENRRILSKDPNPELLLEDIGIPESVGSVHLSPADLIHANDHSRDSLYHEATHAAQTSVGHNTSARHRLYNKTVGYSLNPLEVGARATTAHERLRRQQEVSGFDRPKRVGSYVDRWTDEVNKVLRAYTKSKDPVRQDKGQVFINDVVPEYSQRFFGGNPTKRFVVRDGKLVVEPVR